MPFAYHDGAPDNYLNLGFPTGRRKMGVFRIIRNIDGKFSIAQMDDHTIQIINTKEETVVPEDEPLMLFRARDHLAAGNIGSYLNSCKADKCSEGQLKGVTDRLSLFNQFRADHPERMKQPGSSMRK